MLILSVVLIIPVWSYAEPFQPYTVQAKDFFTLPDMEGQTRSLADYAGKVVLVNFWASWCGPCVHEMPELTRLHNDMADRPFEVIAINVGESKDRVKQFTESIHFEPTVLLDSLSQSFESWSVNILPTSYLIDSHGKLRYRAQGDPGWDQQPTFDVIENLLLEIAN